MKLEKSYFGINYGNTIIDISLLPPCSSTVRKHIARSHYIANMWRNAIHPRLNLDAFENHGWLTDGNIDWIESPYPEDVLNLFTSNDTQIEITEDDIDFGKEDIDLEDLSDVDDDDI